MWISSIISGLNKDKMKSRTLILGILGMSFLWGKDLYAQDKLYPNTFPLSEVTLLDGPFKHAQDLNVGVLLQYDTDRLLAPFLKEAGLPMKADVFPNWEGLDGHIGGHFLGMVSFLIAYICLREYAGGYHARTTKGCYCCTVIVTLAVLAMLFIFRQLNDGGICICMLISGIVIWRQAPQETPSKPLSEIEKALYGKQARKNLLRTGILFGIGYCINREIATGVVSAWMVQMIMLFMGRCFSKNIRYS